MWKKDGKVYDNEGVVVGNLRHSNPTPEQFIAAGWIWEEPDPDDPNAEAQGE